MPYWKLNKLACHSVAYTGKRQEFPWSETKDFINQSIVNTMSFIVKSVFVSWAVLWVPQGIVKHYRHTGYVVSLCHSWGNPNLENPNILNADFYQMCSTFAPKRRIFIILVRKSLCSRGRCCLIFRFSFLHPYIDGPKQSLTVEPSHIGVKDKRGKKRILTLSLFQIWYFAHHRIFTSIFIFLILNYNLSWLLAPKIGVSPTWLILRPFKNWYKGSLDGSVC